MNGTRMTQMTRIYADFFNYSALIRVIRVICVPMPFLLVLSTVFVIDRHLANGVVSGKYFWFYGSMGLVSITALITAFCYKNHFRFSVLDLLLLLFVGSVYLSAFVFNDATQNTTKLTVLALLLVLYFNIRIIVGALRATPLRWVLCGFIVLTGLVEAVWGLRQLYGFEMSQHNLFKMTGSFFNPGPYAGYLAVVFPMALQFWIKSKRRVFSVFSAIACIAVLLVLPAAMSRASWLAVIAGSAIVGYGYVQNKGWSFKCNITTIKKWFAGSLIVLLLLSAAAGMYFLKKNSADGRLLTWKVSLQVIAQHPFGVGLGNFSGAYGEAQATYFASGNASETEEYVAGNPEYGFNEYLQIAIESGIVSLLLFFGIIVAAVRSMIKAKDWGALGSLAALLVFACFSYPFSVLPFLIIFTFLLSTSAAQWNADDADDADLRGFSSENNYKKICANPRYLRHPRSIIALSGLAITCFCLYRQYPVYQACKQWNRQQIYYHSGLYKETAKAYESLYPQLNDQIQFLFEYGQSLSKSEQWVKSNEVLMRATEISCDPMLYNVMGKNYQALKEYDKAEASLIKSTQIAPNRLYPWYLLTKLYVEMDLPDKARETAAVVQTKEPKVQSQAVREMREEMKKIMNNE